MIYVFLHSLAAKIPGMPMEMENGELRRFLEARDTSCLSGSGK